MVNTLTPKGAWPWTRGRARTAGASRARLTRMGMLSVAVATAWWASRPPGSYVVSAMVPVAAPAPPGAATGTTALPALPHPDPLDASTEARSPVRVLALAQDRQGRWLAKLQAGDDPPRLAQTGDVIAHGLRVERIEPGRVTLRRGLHLEMLTTPAPIAAFQQPIEPLPLPPPTVIVSSPGHEPPRSSGVDRAIQRATQGGADRSHWQATLGTGR